MLIRDVMTDTVQSIDPGTTLLEAARLMRDLDVGILPVCEHGKPVGVITDRDLVIRAVAGGADLRTLPAAEAMSAPVFYCQADQEVEEAADLMEARQIRRVLVVDRDHLLIGIVSLGDLALDADDASLAGEVLEEVSADRKDGDDDSESESAA